MAALFALGVMSIAWTALVGALVALDRLLPWRRIATLGTATLLVLPGLLLFAAQGLPAAPHASRRRWNALGAG